MLSSPDEEIRASALTGLLTSAQTPTRKGGLRGWLGEMQQNPMLEKIRGLIGTPVQTEEPVNALPSRAMTGYIPTLPSAEGSLAQSSTAATEVGAPPLAAIQQDWAGPTQEYTEVQGRAPTPSPTPPSAAKWEQQPTPQVGTRTVSKPRHVLYTPEEAMIQRYSGQEKGELEGVISTLTPYIGREAAVKQALEERQRSRGLGGGDRSIFGEILGPDGVWRSGSVIFDPTTGKHLDTRTQQPVLDFRRNVTTGSASQPTDARRIMQELFPGKNLNDLTGEEAARLNAAIAAYGGTKAGATTAGRMEAGAAGPLDKGQRTAQTNVLVKQWTDATEIARTANQQFAMMKVGLDRYEPDRPGASQAILVTFQKILDPPSVVRESEYARSAQGLSLLQWLDGMRERYASGGVGVPREVLAEMVKTAEQFLTARNLASGLENVRGRIQAQAIADEIEPSLVFGADAMAGTGLPPVTVGSPPPGAAAPTGGAGLNATVPGYFVDDSGNLIRR